MRKMKVGVVGLRYSELRGEDPLLTLMGIMPRTWAIYDGLKKYGFDTYMYVEPKVEIDPILSEKPQNFIRSQQAFLDLMQNEFDYTILVGTRIQTLLEQQPWLSKAQGGRYVWAMCYENHPGEVPACFVDNCIAAGFTSPRYSKAFATRYPGIYTRLLTTGQPKRSQISQSPKGDIVYVGHIHNVSNLALFTQIAAANIDREVHVITSRIRKPDSRSGEYLQFAHMEDDQERKSTFKRLVEMHGDAYPSNLQYHFLPHGEEYEVLEKASVGLSISHNKNWKIDNSKVTYYLSFGIPVISQLPSLSHRFCEYFGAGERIAFGASANVWNDAINRWSGWTFEQKVRLRRQAEAFFSWDNVAFEVYDMLLEDMYPLNE